MVRSCSGMFWNVVEISDESTLFQQGGIEVSVEKSQKFEIMND